MTPQSAIRLQVIPLTLEKANQFVSLFHRHNKRVIGAKFSIGCVINDELVGVAIAGRPVARLLDNGKNIEVLRVCVKDGNKNVNSLLYARIKRISQLMGYERVITYTLTSESGSSLKAIGAKQVATVDPQNTGWDRGKRGRRRQTQLVYSKEKIRWEL